MNEDSCAKNGGYNKRPKHPRIQANILSKITFLYNLGFIWKIYKKGTLKKEHIFEVIDNCKAENAGNELEIFLKNDSHHLKHISLIRIIWKCYGKAYLLVGFIQLIVRSAVITLIPMALSKVILYFQPAQEELNKTEVINFAILLTILSFVNITYLQNYLLYLDEFGIKIKTALCSAIFRKSLRLTTKSLSDISVGKIVTLMTKDVPIIESFITYFNDTWIGVMQTMLVFYLIYNKMGVATCVGMGFFVLIVPLQVIIGNITAKLRLACSKEMDRRLQSTKETLSGIRVIKMNSWEEAFEGEINENRKKEMTAILKLFLSKTSVLLMGSLTTKIAYYLLLITYLYLGKTFSAEMIYYVTTLFLRIRHALNTSIPVGVTVVADTFAALTRIKDFILSEETTQKIEINHLENKPQVYFENVTVNVGNKEILKNICLNMESGLVIITGPTGSGKTSLLKCILDENECTKGRVYKSGCISYAQQEPWIFPSSLRQNIIFDQEYDKERYEMVLKACGLSHDINMLSVGDDSMIDDSGTNLSKGQQCRINLARAVYRKADIYLIDDCLTSLDINVQKHVIQSCIKEFLADKICLFVTQNPGLFEGNYKILVIDEEKVVVSQDVFRQYQDISNNLANKEKCLENNDCLLNNDFGTEQTSLLNDKNKKNMYQENIKQGKVEFETYRKYGSNVVMIVIILIFFILTQISKSYSEKILSDWVNIIHRNSSRNTEQNAESDLYLELYSILILTLTILSVISAFLLFNFSRAASINLHKNLVESVINAKMTFFDTHLIGNIINRFSKDLSIVDEQIPFAVYDFLQILLGLFGVVFLIAAVNITLILPTIIFFLILYLIRKIYMPTGRTLQRLDSATRSPIVGYLNSSLEGLTTIKAFRAEKALTKEFDKHQDLYTSVNYTSKCCKRAFGYYMDVFCTIYMGVIMAVFLIFDHNTSVGDIGLAITQAISLNGIVQYGIKQWAEIENKMTSVERILEYSETEKEVQTPNSIIASWPKCNSIRFDKVTFSYGNGSKCILEDINLVINAGERIGIIGRTGSGKTTLLSLLFRLYNYEGIISIGGVDIQRIPLKILRSNISIMSQNPMIFSSTVRKNLDPLNKYSDAEIWRAIKTVQLDKVIKSLNIEMDETGSTLSTGQKQLLCLARCLLNKNRIIILDEATSDMDTENENLINAVFENYFTDCTLLIIAHKLNSILNCDRVLVMQDGKIVENGTVNNLGKDQNSLFHSMLKNSKLLHCI
ncbi:ATP-binding cassette sub-family C member 4-like isoform X1 [Diorhabda carinulata]|uniref:ATP-binding cassette sub-family C member 4-like isoform X1 n=1 Tax=Diorhabda carinulata TaxID=1163345 RepID=UPI00259FFCC9|nr:ATP-binding cassette sub-family C member 4-like isoform X1 [Diorhabda carinulata]